MHQTLYERHDVKVATEKCTIKRADRLLPELVNDPDDESLLKRWIENGDYDTDRYSELPHLHRSDKTRNIVLHDNQKHMYVVLNGGRFREMSADGKAITSSPVNSTRYSENVISTVVTARGEKVTYRDSSPTGGYYPDSLAEKVKTTELIAARLMAALLFRQDAIVVVPVYTAAIKYEPSNEQGQEFAAAAYRIPSRAVAGPGGALQMEDNELLPYILAIELTPSIAIIGNYLANGALVALGFAHPQNHLGNRYLQVDRGLGRDPDTYTGVLTDMEDVMDIKDFPTHSDYTNAELMGDNTTDLKLSPKGKAIATMLARAIDSDASYHLFQYRETAEIDVHSAAVRLIEQLLDPIEAAFILGHQLTTGAASRHQLNEVKRPDSLNVRSVGMLMNGNVVTLQNEIIRLFNVQNRLNFVKRLGAKAPARLLDSLDNEITAVTRMISAIVAKDIIALMDPEMIKEDRFVPARRLIAVTGSPQESEKKPGRKRHKPRRNVS